MRTTLFVLLILLSFNLWAQDIIPFPKDIKAKGQNFQLKPSTEITYSEELAKQATYLAEILSPATGWDFKISGTQNNAANTIQLLLKKDADWTGSEDYSLEVTGKSIKIEASNKAGIFNGIQTLRQLMPPQIYSQTRQKSVEWIIPGVVIKDTPEFQWRGMMLDVSRYFFHKQYVLHLIDMMAMYKMNVLHLHLIDDAGWRLEIKKYPKLTSVGGFRGKGHERTGGYYTQEDIKEIVAYATQRNIEVIPEIEIPAHTLPAIVAYPWLSCTEELHEVQTKHSISRELYCAGKESTFEFLNDVFKEAFELFPSKYVHIGGDEAKYDRWNECPHCKARKKELGIKTGAELQVYFTNRIQKMVAKYGKIIVGWDEIIERGLEDKAVGMVWYNRKKATSAVTAGHDVVMALTGHCYFDVAESKTPGEIKAATWLPPISLEKVYALNPMLEELDDQYRSQILGAHATLWSDQFIHGTILQELDVLNENRSEKYFDYLTLPRMAALAEVCWTAKDKKDWNGFQNRMKNHYKRYDFADYGYRVPEPQLVLNKEEGDGYRIELANLVEDAEIRYTTDGTKPNPFSAKYEGPVFIKDLYNFRAITVVNRQQFSLPFYFNEEDENMKKYGQLLGKWSPGNLSAENFTTVEFDATGKINKNGSYQITFVYSSGMAKLEVESIALYKNQQQIADDSHLGFAGKQSENNIYLLSVDDYETGAAFKIRANIKGDKHKDTYGKVYLKRKD